MFNYLHIPFQLSETVEAVQSALETEKELAEKSQKELEDDLTKSKHRFLLHTVTALFVEKRCIHTGVITYKSICR